MAVLAAHPEGLHGYGIVQELAQVPQFADCPPDMTGLYRVLKSMEEEGYLSSEWDLAVSGPARRVYQLTPDGRECLVYWSQTLQRYAKNLQGTVRYIEASLRPPEVGARRTA